MTEGVDARSGVRLIGGEVDYADGSEDPVLEILEEADDRSTASDELARHISDWPTRYHLSRQRANLLRPLNLGPGARVLDVGAGTGAIARHVAETGADVVALEGTLPRARAAAARCDGLANVEVVCGPVDAFDDADGFDVVLCIGVLEYAGESLLSKLRSLTRPDGVVVVAIENQLGLKYLLGYGEDHLGEPWAGVEGYRTPSPSPSPSQGTSPRTWSRRRLGGLLAQAGFPSQRWLFPFPDYKLPAVVVDEAAYAEVDAPDFVDQIVRWPCSPLASEPARVCDDRLAHRVFLEAGLGPDVANSFLVVAGHDAGAITRRLDPDVAAWFFGSRPPAPVARVEDVPRRGRRHRPTHRPHRPAPPAGMAQPAPRGPPAPHPGPHRRAGRPGRPRKGPGGRRRGPPGLAQPPPHPRDRSRSRRPPCPPLRRPTDPPPPPRRPPRRRPGQLRGRHARHPHLRRPRMARRRRCRRRPRRPPGPVELRLQRRRPGGPPPVAPLHHRRRAGPDPRPPVRHRRRRRRHRPVAPRRVRAPGQGPGHRPRRHPARSSNGSAPSPRFPPAAAATYRSRPSATPWPAPTSTWATRAASSSRPSRPRSPSATRWKDSRPATTSSAATAPP